MLQGLLSGFHWNKKRFRKGSVCALKSQFSCHWKEHPVLQKTTQKKKGRNKKYSSLESAGCTHSAEPSCLWGFWLSMLLRNCGETATSETIKLNSQITQSGALVSGARYARNCTGWRLEAIREFNPRKEGNGLVLSWEESKRGDESGIRPGDGTRMAWWWWPSPSLSMFHCLQHPGVGELEWGHSEAPPAGTGSPTILRRRQLCLSCRTCSWELEMVGGRAHIRAQTGGPCCGPLCLHARAPEPE